VDVVIVNPICIDLVLCVLTMISHTIIFLAQNKTRHYIKPMLGNDFIPLVIETSNCLHPHFDSYVISCVHVNITHHQHTSSVPLMFIPYYRFEFGLGL
jgi:hypothetical protein